MVPLERWEGNQGELRRAVLGTWTFWRQERTLSLIPSRPTSDCSQEGPGQGLGPISDPGKPRGKAW